MSTPQKRCPIGSRVRVEGDPRVPRHATDDPIEWTVESYEVEEGRLFVNLTGLRQYNSLHMIMNGPGHMWCPVSYRADLETAHLVKTGKVYLVSTL